MSSRLGFGGFGRQECVSLEKGTSDLPWGTHPPTPFEETLSEALLGQKGPSSFWHVLVFLDPHSHEIACIFLCCIEKVSFRYQPHPPVTPLFFTFLLSQARRAPWALLQPWITPAGCPAPWSTASQQARLHGAVLAAQQPAASSPCARSPAQGGISQAQACRPGAMQCWHCFSWRAQQGLALDNHSNLGTASRLSKCCI